MNPAQINVRKVGFVFILYCAVKVEKKINMRELSFG